MEGSRDRKIEKVAYGAWLSMRNVAEGEEERGKRWNEVEERWEKR